MDTAASQAGWQAHAACLTADPELFFPLSDVGPGAHQAAKAKAVCTRCAVRAACLEHAMATGQVHGVWGGTTEKERQILRSSWPRHREARHAAVRS